MSIPVTSVAAAGTAGTLAAPTAPLASETINKVYVGKILEVSNASVASITVTFTDPGETPAGNTGTQAGFPVAAGAKRRWRLTRQFVGDAGIQVGFSSVTSITAEIVD